EATPAQMAALGELFLEVDDVKAAKEMVTRLAADKSVATARLQARLHMRDGDWGQARVTLERHRSDNLPASESRQFDVLLGSCYERLDDPEAALTAYRRALRSDPMWLPASRGEISALLTLGKLDEAEQAYARVCPKAPEMYLGLAQLLLARQLKRPLA